MNWGAENRDGSSGKNIAVRAGQRLRVRGPHVAPHGAGGSVSIPFDISSKKTGTWHSDASMTSNTTPGTTVVTQTITITP